MIFRIDEDSVVRASGHTGFASDADGFIKVHDPIRALEHSGSWAGHDTGSMRALITASHLMRTPHLREHANVDVLDISARHADGNNVFGLARSGTRVTADAPRVIDYLCPLHAVFAYWLLVDHLSNQR
jgi:hypothetical protein